MTKMLRIACEGTPQRHLLTIPLNFESELKGAEVGLSPRGYTLVFVHATGQCLRTHYIKGVPHHAYGEDCVRRSLLATIRKQCEQTLHRSGASSNRIYTLYDAITDVIISDSFFRFR